jgi:DNA-binding NarL/FixJ family response regulator
MVQHVLPVVSADLAVATHIASSSPANIVAAPETIDRRTRVGLHAAIRAAAHFQSRNPRVGAYPLLSAVPDQSRRRIAESILSLGIGEPLLSVTPVDTGLSLLCVARNHGAARSFTRLERAVLHLLHSGCAAAIADAGRRGSTETMSPRADQIAALLLKGHSEQRIAELLGISRSTVHTYVIAIYRRHGVHSRAELAYRILGS